MPIPTLTSGSVGIRPIRLRDARAVERELVEGRSWMREWEATSPRGSIGFDTRGSIRALQQNARNGQGLPFIIEVDGELAGQLNVTSISYGSLSSATIGYWIAERFAGRNATPIAVALATTASRRSACTGWRSASGPRTRSRCGSCRSSGSGTRA